MFDDVFNIDERTFLDDEAINAALSSDTIDKESLKDVLFSCMTSTRVMANVFFPHHCYRPFSAAHEPMFKLLDDDSKRLVLIQCPRGWGKTTIAGLVFPAKKILFKDCNYIIYLSSTATKAISDLQTLAAELQSNETIKKLFGNVRGVRWAEGTGELVVNVLGKDIKIEGKGAGQQIRGMKFRENRPDLYIVDDLEDKESVLNEERRAKLKRWFFSDVLNSIDLRGARIVMLGTLLHEDSLIANISREADWDSLGDEEAKLVSQYAERFECVKIEACDDSLRSTWPEYMSDEKIKAKYIAYQKRGILDEFYREFRNMIVPSDGGTFSASMFRYYDEDFRTLNSLDNVVLIDPAKTTTISSADSAIVGVAFDGVNNRIYFRDCVRGKLHPDQIYAEACSMADRLNTNVIGVEVTSLNEFITYPLRAYISSRSKHYNIVELKARGKKEDRIRALLPFYRMGAIYHNSSPGVRGALEAQLLAFPYGKMMDVIDVFAYCVEMFDIGDRVFSSYSAFSDSEEDEFKVLEEDDYDTYAPSLGYAV